MRSLDFLNPREPLSRNDNILHIDITQLSLLNLHHQLLLLFRFYQKRPTKRICIRVIWLEEQFEFLPIPGVEPSIKTEENVIIGVACGGWYHATYGNLVITLFDWQAGEEVLLCEQVVNDGTRADN